MIPVAVLTGFLGSGKTTLLSYLLKQPAFARTAVIINEFGEIGLDHDLVEASDESFIELKTGCLCCTIRSDLEATLADLVRRRDDGRVPPFEQVVIETSGLADPAPILQLLMTDAALAERLALAGVVTTVDAVNGARTLERQPESVKQAAIADRLIVTMTDLTGGVPAELRGRIARLNPGAPILVSNRGTIDPESLFEGGLPHAAGKMRDIDRWLSDLHAPDGHVHHFASSSDMHRHHDEIACFAIVRPEPIRAIALTLFLETLAEHSGGDLLRMKGIVKIAEWPERPAVIHGVQHVFHPPAWLERWPSEDTRSRLVFITRGIPRTWIETLLEALDAEVAEVADKR